MNENKQQFLKEFIDQFFEKAKNKSRTTRNSINVITKHINNITKKHFDENLNFSEEEIIEAFKACDYVILNNFGRESNFEKWKNGTLLEESLFINIKGAKLKRLSLINLKSNNNWGTETAAEVFKLKQSIKEFWETSNFINEYANR